MFVAPISRAHFARRLLRHAGYGGILVGVSLLLGTGGFIVFAGQDWLDAFLDTAMLLGGMGPIGDPTKWPRPGKMFGAIFALYAGLVFLIMAGLLATPMFHRVLHRFHWESRENRSHDS